MSKKRRGGEEGFKPTINNLFNAFEHYIEYDKGGYYILSRKEKNKKEKVIAMSNSPSQLLSRAYIELNLKSVIYMSDVVSFIVDMEQNGVISKINKEINKNIEKFLNQFLNKNNTGILEEDGGDNRV